MAVIDVYGETAIVSSRSAYSRLLARLGEIADLHSASSLMEWEQETHMPEGGASARASVMATLGRIEHEMLTSPETLALLDAAEQEQTAAQERSDLDSQADSDHAALLRETRIEYEMATKVPADFVGEFSHLASEAQVAWAKARRENNFSIFQPYLEKIFAMARTKAEYLGYEVHPYDALLKEFEPGMTTAELRTTFSDLKAKLVPLLARIKESTVVVDDSIVRKGYPVDQQLGMCQEFIAAIGVDPKRSRLDTSAHPFMAPISSPFDVRLTTRALPKLLNAALFGAIHEGGHALFELGINPALARTPLANINSMGLHESQSRLWENMIGRSREFWQHQFLSLQKRFPEQLGNEQVETFYRAVNKVQPSCIRVEADEVTYSLHIILRFELEVDILEGKVAVSDLPKVWNDRFEEMFGIRPASDAEGVLQDVHWSGGAIGYFPTYALGNLIAAALLSQVKKDIPELMQQVASGNYDSLLSWLRTNVHQYGRKYRPAQLVERITGQKLSSEAFVAYLEAKYAELYALN